MANAIAVGAFMIAILALASLLRSSPGVPWEKVDPDNGFMTRSLYSNNDNIEELAKKLNVEKAKTYEAFVGQMRLLNAYKKT